MSYVNTFVWQETERESAANSITFYLFWFVIHCSFKTGLFVCARTDNRLFRGLIKARFVASLSLHLFFAYVLLTSPCRLLSSLLLFLLCVFFLFVGASFAVSFSSNNEIKWREWKKEAYFFLCCLLHSWLSLVLLFCMFVWFELFALCIYTIYLFFFFFCLLHFCSFSLFLFVLHIDSHMACANICFEVVIFHLVKPSCSKARTRIFISFYLFA